MRNLVTGASGFIGSFIAEELIKKGEEVRAFVRKTSDTKFLKSIGAEIFCGDLHDAVTINESVKGIDKVFHSAAMVGDWVPREEAFRINVNATKLLLKAAKIAGVKRFIYVSSLAVLGMEDHYGTPSNPPASGTGDIYADTKIAAENIVTAFGKKERFPVTIIRPGFVFGPRDNKVIPTMVDFLKRGKYMFIGSGKNKVNMIYVENLADAAIKASNSDRAIGEAYNLTNDSGMTMMDVVDMVAKLWGYKRPTKHVPKPVAYVLCAALEFFAHLAKAKNPPLLNKTRLKFLSLNLDFDISKARDHLGYTPKVDMLEGLKRTKRWIEKEGIVK